MTQVAIEPPLIFVWAGKRLPNYAKHSIRMAAARYSGPVILLSEEQPEDQICKWYDISKFNNQLWDQFRVSFALDPDFRGGLWLRAYQRFFILDEFCRQHGIERAFHAELDALVLELDGFSSRLDTYGEAIFLPLVDTQSAVASLVYWNSPEALQSLCRFFADQGGIKNEMNALADFLQMPGAKAFSFATEQSWDTPRWPYIAQTVSHDDGIVDADAIAKWLFGQGPKTTQCTIWSKQPPNVRNSLPIGSLRFRPGLSGRTLRARTPDGEWRQIRTLHVASKIHRALAIPVVFSFLVWASRLQTRLPIVPRVRCLQKLLTKRIVRHLGLNSRFLNKATIEAISRWLVTFTNRRGINLSNSQRNKLARLVRPKKLRGRPVSVARLTLGFEGPGNLTSAPSANAASTDSSSRIMFSSPRIEMLSGQETLPELLRRGLEHFGLNPDLEGAPLLADLDLWPIFLSTANEIEGVLVQDEAVHTSNEVNPLLTDKQQLLILDVEKNHWSRQRVRSLMEIDDEAPAWSCNPRRQLYRVSHLREMFPNQEALLDWWRHGRTGFHKATLADYYGAWLLRKKVPVRVAFRTDD